MAEETGLTANYLYQLESGGREPSDSARKLFELLERSYKLDEAPPAIPPAHLEAVRQGKLRLIPVVGWAHAGEAASYEEIPQSWADMVPTECRDERAFGLRLEGDSMEASDGGGLSFRDGDLLVAMPSARPYSGCFVVAKFTNDGVTFRRLETVGRKIILAPLNKRYDVTEHDEHEFHWIYPVWGRWSQLYQRPM